VHALGQVASFHTTSPIPADHFRAALQVHLPHDVVILESSEAAPNFHATFAAKSKRYRYVLYNGMMMLPFLQRFAYHIRKPLDVAAMHAAGQVLLGTHDFRSFETDWPNKATSVRTVMDLTVCRTAVWQPWSNAIDESNAGDGEFIVFEVKADGFLYNMVRTIVGTLINVGRGRWSAEDVRQILADQDRRKAGNTAPACGLYLVQVDY
jgi:tRNA pseudouridine38-40 synthase